MRFHFGLHCLIGGLLLSTVQAASAATFVVNNNGDLGDVNLGDNQCNILATTPAVCTLRAAIQQANVPGETDLIQFSQDFTITATSNFPEITESLQIDATGQTVIVDGDNAFSLFRITAASSGDYIFTNFTVRNARAPAGVSGGGIFLGAGALSALRLNDMTLSGNQSTTDGGGLAFASPHRVFITGGTFSNNAATATGGAIFNNGGQLTISGATFSDNSAAQAGGAIYNSNGTLAVDTTAFNNNSQTTAGVGGGAIYTALATAGSTTLNQVSFAGNQSQALGGALYVSNALNDASKVSIDTATFDTNTAAHGGAIAIQRGGATLDTATLSGNSATQDGGAVYLGYDADSLQGGAIHLRTCTIAGNTATGFGGAIANDASNPPTDPSSMVHCTVALNSAASGGGFGLRSAVVNEFPGTAAAPFTSNIVAGNTASGVANDCQNVFVHADADNSGYNVSETTSCGFTQASDAQGAGLAKLGALQDRGGPTVNGVAMRTVNIQAGSAAIDGANQNATWVTSTDQRGAPVADGDEDAGSTKLRDAGAYEYAAHGAVEFVAGSTTVNETESSVQLQVRRYGETGTATTVTHATADGTATAGSDPGDDYTATTGTLTFPAGSTAQQSFSIPLVDDQVVEGSESFTAELNLPINKESDFGARVEHTINITDVEHGVIAFDPASLNITQAESTTTLTLSVKRTGGKDGIVTIDFTTADGGGAAGTDATAGADYTANSGTLTWADQDDADKTITITLINDTDEENDEFFNVQLSNVGGGARLGADTRSLITITSADLNGEIAFDVASVDPMIAESALMVTLTVNRTGGKDGAVTIDFASADGDGDVNTADAVAGMDYTATSGTLSWADQDDAPKTITVMLIDDTKLEPDEHFNVQLSNPVGGAVTLGTNDTSVVKITSADVPGAIAFTNTTITATEAGLMATLTVSRSGGDDGTVTVDYTTLNAPSGMLATAGTDYTATSGTLTWNDQDSANKTITVMLINDGEFEYDEVFDVQLSNPTGDATLPTMPDTSRAQVTITSEDAAIPGTIRLKATSFLATETGGSVVITATRENGDDRPVTVEFGTSDGTALSGFDYGTAGGTLSWAHNESGDKTFTVNIINDTNVEANETFTVTLSNAQSSEEPMNPPTLADATGTVTIESDEKPQFSFTATGYTTTESGGSVTVSVQPSQAISGGPVTITLTTLDGSAVAGSDYTALTPPGNQLVFNHGDNAAKSLSIPIASDGVVEQDESFQVEMTAIAGGGVAGGVNPVTVTITGDSIVRFASSTYSSLTEAGDVTLTVERSGPNGTAATVEYTITAGSATQGVDYTTPSGSFSGMLNCAAGATSCDSIVINVLADSAIEADEGFTVTLSNPGGALLQPGTESATGTILDDDFEFLLDAASYSMTEGTAAGGSVTVTVRRVGTNRGAASVAFADVAGSATRNIDYAQASGTLSFPDGGADPRAEQQQTVVLQAVADQIDESDESFSFELSAPSAPGRIGTPASATVTVQDDDTAGVTISKTTAAVTEGGASDSYTVVLDTQPTDVVTVNLSALAGQLSPTPTSLTFSPSDSSPQRWDLPQTVTINASNDTDLEGAHSDTLRHAASGTDANYNGIAVADVATDITDNDAAIRFTSAAFSGTEGGADVVISAERIGSTIGTAGVDFATADGSATAASGDYTAASGQLSWADGEGGTKTFSVTIGDDQRVEGDETVTLNLTNAVGAGGGEAALGTPNTATLTIADDADAAGVTLTQSGGDTQVTEGGGTDTYAIVLNSEPSGDVTITIAGDAQAGVNPTTLTFTPANFATPQTVTVTATNDTALEGTHSGNISHTVSSTDAAYDGMPVANVTAAITDNDSEIRLTAATLSVMEGNSVTVTAERIGSTIGEASVSYATSDGTATASAGDYVAASGTLVWADGVGGTMTFMVDAPIDGRLENEEAFSASLSNAAASGAGQVTLGAPASATITITDADEAGIALVESGDSTAVIEGGAADSYTVVLTAQPRADVVVTIATGGQVSASPETLTFTPANYDVPQAVMINAVNDTTVEAALTDTVTHSVTSADAAYDGFALGDVTAAVADNDSLVRLTSATLTVTEGTTANAVLTVERIGSTIGAVSVSFATAADTASAGADFASRSDTLTWSDGEAGTRTITVPILDDALAEVSENFSIVLANVVNTSPAGQTGLGAPSTAVVTITDDDMAGIILTESGDSTSVSEGGAVDTLTVVLQSQPTSPVTVTFLTGSQLTAAPSSVTFDSTNWNSTVTVTIQAVDDGAFEGNHSETVSFSVTSEDFAYGGQTIAARAVAITDNDQAPSGGGGGALDWLMLGGLLGLLGLRRRIAAA